MATVTTPPPRPDLNFKRAAFERQVKDLPLLGEIITWEVSGEPISHRALVTALVSSGLDEKLAREIIPRHAWSRASKRLNEGRIIRLVDEDKESIKFQFTAETKEGDSYVYTKETVLTLNKETGKITCELPGLATLAQEHLDRAMEERTASDVTRIVQALFDRNADLFPIRRQGGCYFTPIKFADFLAQVELFLNALAGRMNRFPVPAGTVQGDKSVQEAVADGLAHVLSEHEKATREFGLSTRQDTLERAADKLRQTKEKIESYASYLADSKSKLEEGLAAATELLRKRIADIAETNEAEFRIACEECHRPAPVVEGQMELVCACGYRNELEW